MSVQVLDRKREPEFTTSGTSADRPPTVRGHRRRRWAVQAAGVTAFVCLMGLTWWAVRATDLGDGRGTAVRLFVLITLWIPFAIAPPGFSRGRTQQAPTGARSRTKRLVDVIGASVGLVVALPVLVAAAILVKVVDRGPVLFRQPRVGLAGTEFVMLKLRTMVPDAEDRRSELLEQNLRTGPLFKARVDPRVTTVGRWLRALSIDELPQLVNVVRGEMSLVGPRPALASETDQFDAEFRDRRHTVRPGVTGLWQVEARDDPCIHVYRHLDLCYVESWTVRGDLVILVRTVGVVVVGGSQRLLRGERR
jgi:lipopolysaccharide/colanic/teichoic acid biosynthesis glycosyltransferase